MHTVRRKGRRLRAKPRFWALVLALSLCTAAFAAIQLYASMRPYSAARDEYDALRSNYAPEITPGTLPATVRDAGSEAGGAAETPKPVSGPAAVNPEYVGWLRAEDIDYPVALGADNEKYLNTSFSGEENKLGAIFMDYRCMEAFGGPYTILYGHNAKDGSMFGSLSRYLDADYRREHPAIEITTAGGETLTYRILTAQVTDIHDEAFSLPGADADTLAVFARSIGAPDGTAPLLTLSTCTDYGGKDKRLVVHAVLD